MNRLGSERSAVQNPILIYSQQIDWTYLKPEEAVNLREGETSIILKDIFIRQISKLNQEFITENLISELINKLKRIAPNISGNLDSWEYLKGLKTLFEPSEDRERNVKLIDTDNIGNNEFHVTDELVFTNGNETIRLDVVFFINGFPVFFTETKSAHKIEGLSDALVQVTRYHRECPEILAMLQVYSITHLIKYYYSATWNTTGKLLYNWKDEAQGDFESLVKAFFDKERIVRLLTDFILFTREDDELKKVVLRPHQIRAVNKVIERSSDSEKHRGLIWHTQGSGKTYSMIVAAKKIIENPALENPTVLMLVDRNELETQLFNNISAVGIEHVNVTDSKKHLRELLSADTRGLIVSMIHKFLKMPENVNTRSNFFVLVDEAHRTTGGDLGNYLMGTLPNATYIGFTGTPIDRTAYGKGTFITFGKDDPPQGYLDKYSIAESIEDKTTVPLHYALAANELRVDKDVLEKEFWSLAETEGISDIEELNKILDKAVTLRNMLKNKERVPKVGEYMANHYKEHIEPLGYKAFVVAVDREACRLYKNELDKHLPAEYSEVIYSPFYNDPPELSKYHLPDDKEKQIRKDFRKPDKLPKILIVTEKLLTGFDAPILYCMYLDKPMRDHVLLQAIARVNRPYEDNNGKLKPSGFVLDFVGIFDKLEKALAFDSNDIEGVIKDIEILKDHFKELIDKARKDYLSIIEGLKADKAVEAVLNHFIDEEPRHEYYQDYREIADIYDIISPDAFLRPYIDDVETLARMYRILREAYEPSSPIDRDFSKKTIELVKKHTTGGQIKSSLEIFKINKDTLQQIEDSRASDTEKIFNLIKSIAHVVINESDYSPYLISIGDRAEKIVEQFKRRQKNTQDTLNELKKLIEEINIARKEQQEKNMPKEVFSVYWIIRSEGVENPEEKANQVRPILEQYPHFKTSQQHERKVRQELYKIALDKTSNSIQKAKELVQKILRVIKGKA